MTARGKVSVPAESRARRWLLPKGYSRHPGDVVRLVLGILILLLTTSAIHKDFVGSREAAVFRLFNTLALPDWTWPGVWLVMQLGVIAPSRWWPSSQSRPATYDWHSTPCWPPGAST